MCSYAHSITLNQSSKINPFSKPFSSIMVWLPVKDVSSYVISCWIDSTFVLSEWRMMFVLYLHSFRLISFAWNNFWLIIFPCKLFLCTSLYWLYKSVFKLYCIVVLCHCCMTIQIYNPTLSICTYESSHSHWYVYSECRPVPSMQACSDRASTILEGEQNNWRDRRFPEEPLWQTTRHCHCTGTQFILLILWSAFFMQIYLLQI